MTMVDLTRESALSDKLLKYISDMLTYFRVLVKTLLIL